LTDSGDRLGLFQDLRTYGKSPKSQKPTVAVVEGTIYVMGGYERKKNKLSNKVTAIDVEIDCFREIEPDLLALPNFSSLNKHLKVVGPFYCTDRKLIYAGIMVEDMGARYDGQICDPYLSVADPEQPEFKQASTPCKATLSPVFDHEFYFYDVESRKSTMVTFEIRDLKDGYLYGSC
jgi:hypothetical protein